MHAVGRRSGWPARSLAVSLLLVTWHMCVALAGARVNSTANSSTPNGTVRPSTEVRSKTVTDGGMTAVALNMAVKATQVCCAPKLGD